MQLGSRCSSQTLDGDVLMACCLVKKYGTHVIKICCNTNLGAENTMVASELTGEGHFGGVRGRLYVPLLKLYVCRMFARIHFYLFPRRKRPIFRFRLGCFFVTCKKTYQMVFPVL